MANMIITSECEKCIHSTIDESDKSWIKIYCAAKDKTYYWGAMYSMRLQRKENNK